MNTKGYVYLLHFDRPLHPAVTNRHYIGYSDDLPARIQAHELGHGARFCQVARQRGIRFRVVRVWHGDKKLERRLKQRKNAPRLCPICGSVQRDMLTELTPAAIADALIPF